MQKFCIYCGKEIKRKDNISDYHFKIKQFCNYICGKDYNSRMYYQKTKKKKDKHKAYETLIKAYDKYKK